MSQATPHSVVSTTNGGPDTDVCEVHTIKPNDSNTIDGNSPTSSAESNGTGQQHKVRRLEGSRLAAHMQHLAKKVMKDLDDEDSGDDSDDESDENVRYFKSFPVKKGAYNTKVATQTFIGEIDTDHALSHGIVKSGVLKNAFVMREYPNIAFVGIRQAKPYLEYSIEAILESGTASLGAYSTISIARITTFTTTPLAPNVDTVSKVLELEGLLEKGDALRIVSEMEKEYNSKNPGIDDTPDGVLITKFNILRKMLCDLYPGKTIQLQQANIMFDMSIPDKGTMLAESLWTKRYFMGWQISKLQMLYSMDDLLSLPIEKISALDSMVTKDTVRLFFSRRIPFNCVRTRNVPGKGEMWKLHELKQKHVSIIKDVYGVEMSVTDYLQVCIYNYMIERGKQGRHTITLATSMLEDICGSNTSMRSSFYPAMKILLDSYCDVVEDEVDDDIVYLRDHYAADAYICEALKTLFENDRSVARKREMGILYDAVCRGRATKTAPMCDEQMDAMKKHVSFPFLYVGGTGGSGKTRFLEHVAALHSGWGKVYAMSFMASVADVLYERLGETATVSTCHSFLCEHMGKCPSVSQVAARLGGKCPIERVEVLLVDEFSTMYTMLFSVVLATFMQCSSLKRVVVTGDHRQLPSIMEGNILKDFVKGLGWAFVDFRHNHRVKDPAFALIRNNADAIANGRFFDMRFDSKVVTLVSPQSDSKQGYQECLRSKLVERNYGQYEFHSVSRTNEMKGALTEVLEPHYLNKPTRWSAIYVGSKFIIRKNSKDLRLINNRILVLTDVWDQRKVSGGSMPLCGFENDFNIPSKNQGRYSNPGSVWRDSTETPVQSGYVRYIAFVSLEKMDSARQVLLLTSKLNRRLVKASATTNHCFQGKEIDHFAFVSKIYHCSFDTREGLYTASTRPKKSMLYISSKEALRKMCENPEPDRDTGLAAMLERTLSPYREGVFEQMRALDKLYTPGKGVVEAFISGEGDTGTTQTPTHTTGFCDKSTPGGQSDHGCKRKDTLQANDDVHAPTKTPKLSQDSRPDNTEAQSAPNPPRISIAKRNPPTIIKYNTVPRQGTESVTAVPMSQEKLALSPEPSLVNETKGANSTPKPSAPKRDTKVNAGQPKKTATATITTTATSKQNTSTTRAVKK